MSELWRKTLVYLGLVEEPEEHDEHEHARVARERTRAEQSPPAEDETRVRALRAVEDGNSHVRPVAAGPATVAIVRPLSFDDAEEIGARYRSAQPVLVDLAQVEKDLAQRILDFIAGTIFALRGRIIPSGQRAYLLVPDGVEIAPDERRRLRDLGYEPATPAPPAENR